MIKAFIAAAVRKLPKLVLNPQSVDNVMQAFNTATADLDKVIKHHDAKIEKHHARIEKSYDAVTVAYAEVTKAERVKAELAAFLA